MPLTIVTTTDERVLPAKAVDALAAALSVAGQAQLLVPSFEHGSRVQRELAQVPGMALGVGCSTPSAWASELWQLWGDGTAVVDAITRRLLMRRAVEAVPVGARGALRDNPGTIEVLGRMASRALPWLPLGPDGEPDVATCAACGLSESEEAAVRAVGAYAAQLHARGLMETSEVMAQAPAAMATAGAARPGVVVCGFKTLRRAEREMLVSLAQGCEVTVVMEVPEGPAGSVARASVELLAAAARRAGARVTAQLDEGASAARRVDELQELLAALYQPCEPVRSRGAVRLLQPAGPVAEWELVARHVCQLADTGAGSVVVSATDPRAAWHALAPKLAARGLGVRARLSEPLMDLSAGRVLVAYLQQAAQLKQLSESWPAREACEEGELVHLADMSWWPPKGIVDFLMHDMSGISRSRAWDLDRAWRANRLLTPADVLDELTNPKKTSTVVARATAELMLGRVGSAASKLMAPYRDGGSASTDATAAGELARQEVMGTLQATMMVAGACAQLGVTAAPLADDAVPLYELVDQVADELACISLVITPSLAGEKGACEVTICSPKDAAALPAGSVDSVVVCGQTAIEAAVGRSDDVLSEVLDELGVEPAADKLAQARADFWHTLAAARASVAVERCLFDADAKPTFPSVMLAELYGAYGIPGSAKPLQIVALPHVEREEGLLAQNLLTSGHDASRVPTDVPAPAGKISGDATPLILVPNNGQAELPQGRPSLSASQIESYLECPYKWFSLRRLRLEGIDAGFGSAEQGTFVHRVLELAHLRLLEEASAEADLAGQLPDLVAHPEARLAGSRVDAANVEHAKQVVREVFDDHLRHQYLARKRVTCMDQLLVPHFTPDEEEIERMRADLESTMDFEAGILLGYEPRFMEWGFGGPHDEPVGYAGVWLNGKIDRMDVDGEGRALIVDYKHRSPARFSDYDAFSGDFDPHKLPRHVQSLIYAQVVRRMHPEIKLVGALFLCTKGDHALAGACAESQVDRVLGCTDKPAPDRRRASMGIAGAAGGTEEFWEYLDDVEAMVSEKISELLAGKIDANPVDADACSYCPVLHCEKRMGAR